MAGSGKTFSLSELLGMVQERENRLNTLKAEKQSHVDAIAKIDAEIASIGGENLKIAPKRGRPRKADKAVKTEKRGRKASRAARAHNDRPLADYIVDVLTEAKSPLRVKDVAAAVQAKGYKSNSKGFYSCVATALGDTRKFVAVSRGQYTLAGASTSAAVPTADNTVVATPADAPATATATA